MVTLRSKLWHFCLVFYFSLRNFLIAELRCFKNIAFISHNQTNEMAAKCVYGPPPDSDDSDSSYDGFYFSDKVSFEIMELVQFINIYYNNVCNLY